MTNSFLDNFEENFFYIFIENEGLNTSLVAPGALAHRLIAAPPAKSNMAARGPQNGRRSLERGVTLVYWPFRATFAK